MEIQGRIAKNSVTYKLAPLTCKVLNKWLSKTQFQCVYALLPLAKGHCMTRRNQMPIKCPGCNEKVVKSYRCVMRGTAPVHIKPLFQQQADDMLRICRKCVMKKGKS